MTFDDRATPRRVLGMVSSMLTSRADAVNRAGVIAMAASVFAATCIAGCGGSGRPVGPSVAQIQALVNEKLNPRAKSCTVEPQGTSAAARALAKAKEFNCYPDLNRHIDSQTKCVEESADRFKCLTTYSDGARENELTNATCSRGAPLSCIIETTQN